MIERIYFLSAVVKNQGAIRLHFHTNIHVKSFLERTLDNDRLQRTVMNQPFIMQGDKVILTAFNRIK